MNTTMLAAAQIIARARDVVREAGRDHRHNDAVVPDAEFQALGEALDDYDGLEELSSANKKDWRDWLDEECEDGADDMKDTEASVGADIVRQIRGGCKR